MLAPLNHSLMILVIIILRLYHILVGVRMGDKSLYLVIAAGKMLLYTHIVMVDAVMVM